MQLVTLGTLPVDNSVGVGRLALLARVFPSTTYAPSRVFPSTTYAPSRVFPSTTYAPSRVFPSTTYAPSRVFPSTTYAPSRVFPSTTYAPSRVFPSTTYAPKSSRQGWRTRMVNQWQCGISLPVHQFGFAVFTGNPSQSGTNWILQHLV